MRSVYVHRLRRSAVLLAGAALVVPLISLATAQQPGPGSSGTGMRLDPNSDSTPAIIGPPRPNSAPRTVPETPSTRQPGPAPRVDQQPTEPGRAPPPRAAAAPVPPGLIERVQRLVDQSNYGAAFGLVDAAVREQGETAGLVLLRARIYCAQGRNQDCLRGVDRSLELDPQSSEAYLTRARVFGFNLPKIEANRRAALSDFEQAQHLAPTAANPPFFLGLFHLEIGRDLNLALEQFDRAIALEPGHRRAHGRKVSALYEHGQWDRALASADQAARQAPNAPEPLAVRALVNIARGNVAAAERDLKTSQSLNQGFEVMTGLGVTALAANRAFSPEGAIVSTGRR
jgi:tetratricopeptide (TPR) repeat protein